MPIFSFIYQSSTSFWSDARSEPKRKYRFTFDVGGLPLWTITRVSRPSFNITETPHAFYNHTFYYPGRVEWQTVSFTTVDPINPDATGILMKMLYASGYQFPDKQFGGDGYNYAALNKPSSIESLNPVTITAYDSYGGEVEKWTLRNAFLKNVGMGEFEYASDDMVNMEIEVRYDWATIESLNGRAPFRTDIDAPPFGDDLVGP